MTRESLSPPVNTDRRCPNCGTRVARDADSCFMCGHNLRIQPKRPQRVAWVDVLLVLAVVAVLMLWWQLGSQPQQVPGEAVAQGILPADVPLLEPTLTAAATLTPTVTPEPTQAALPYITHEVQEGETLLAIAVVYNISVEEIQAANNLTDEFIGIGDRLIIPLAVTDAQPPSELVTSQVQYTVRPGDTIVSIALTSGSSTEEILRANNLTPTDFIQPGDVLAIPVPQLPKAVLDSTVSTNTTAVATPAGEQIIYLEPRSLGPPDDAVVARDEAVLLRWISVDVLAPNEWYVLLISPAADDAKSLPSIWTKATSHRLETDLAPELGQSAQYAWQVSVVRVKTGAGGQTLLEAASSPGELRYFTWQ